jgi:thiol-disulfide isomerase/thioredoxin
MSRICDSQEAVAAVKSGAGVFVLFYADWCPFSRAFLPVYEKLAAGRDGEFLRVVLDGNEDFFRDQAIEVYPSVLFFKGGRVTRRLDGRHLAGLREEQLADLIASCDRNGD